METSLGVYLGIQDDYDTIDMSLIEEGRECIMNAYKCKKEDSLFAAVETAQRINSLPKVNETLQSIMREAEDGLIERLIKISRNLTTQCNIESKKGIIRDLAWMNPL